MVLFTDLSPPSPGCMRLGGGGQSWNSSAGRAERSHIKHFTNQYIFYRKYDYEGKIFLPEIHIVDIIGGNMNKGEDLITTLVGGCILSISICTACILLASWIFS